MATRKTYQELYDENIKFSDKITQLNLKIDINKAYMADMEKQNTNAIKTEFFKDKSLLKIQISNAFEMNTMAELAKAEPVEFVKKYLRQYKPTPQVMKYDGALIRNIVAGVAKIKKIFTSEKVHNAPHDEFLTATRGIIIKAVTHDGGPYDRDWSEAVIKLSFNSDEKELIYQGNDSAWQIYKLLSGYNREKHK